MGVKGLIMWVICGLFMATIMAMMQDLAEWINVLKIYL